jgi:hypothetical protein
MKHLRLVRFALVAAGVSVAVPSFACGDHEKGGKDANADKTKSEKNDKKDDKKPANPA